MPEHVHLLVGEPLVSSLSVALQVLKQKTSRKLNKIGYSRFCQRRYYDFNVHSEFKDCGEAQVHTPQPVKEALIESMF